MSGTSQTTGQPATCHTRTGSSGAATTVRILTQTFTGTITCEKRSSIPEQTCIRKVSHVLVSESDDLKVLNIPPDPKRPMMFKSFHLKLIHAIDTKRVKRCQ